MKCPQFLLAAAAGFALAAPCGSAARDGTLFDALHHSTGASAALGALGGGHRFHTPDHDVVSKRHAKKEAERRHHHRAGTSGGRDGLADSEAEFGSSIKPPRESRRGGAGNALLEERSGYRHARHSKSSAKHGNTDAHAAGVAANAGDGIILRHRQSTVHQDLKALSHHCPEDVKDFELAQGQNLEKLRNCVKALEELTTLANRKHQESTEHNQKYVTALRQAWESASSLASPTGELAALHKAAEREHQQVLLQLRSRLDAITEDIQKLEAVSIPKMPELALNVSGRVPAVAAGTRPEEQPRNLTQQPMA